MLHAIIRLLFIANIILLANSAYAVQPYMLGTVSYVAAEEEGGGSNPNAGRSFYVANVNNQVIYQYDCSAAYDLTTCSAATSYTYTNAASNSSVGLSFSSDGTKMYILFSSDDTIYQYACSTGWAVSSCSYDSKSLSVTGIDAIPASIKWKTDGTKLALAGDLSNSLYQLNCSTAWDVTSCTAGTSVSVSSQGTNVVGVAVAANGDLYFVNNSGGGESIYQYTCSTDWDFSTCSYASKSLSVSSQESTPKEMIWSNDGDRLFLNGASNIVRQYDCSGAFDLSTCSYSTGLAVSGSGNTPLAFQY